MKDSVGNSCTCGIEVREWASRTYSINALFVFPPNAPRKPRCNELRNGFFANNRACVICAADSDCNVEGCVEIVVETDGGFFMVGIDQKFL